MTMVTCPTCKGKKTVDVTIEEMGKDTQTMTLGCVVCDGKGEVTTKRALAIMAFNAAQCQCEDVGDNVKYYADGARRDCHKHHWRHEPGCGKIVQIG